MTYREYCKAELGYECITTYWEDFSIAEKFGINAVKDTFKRALLNTDYKMMTELVMVLNHKLWKWYKEEQNGWPFGFAELYDELYRKCDEICCNTFNKEQLAYYYRVTD